MVHKPRLMALYNLEYICAVRPIMIWLHPNYSSVSDGLFRSGFCMSCKNSVPWPTCTTTGSSMTKKSSMKCCTLFHTWIQKFVFNMPEIGLDLTWKSAALVHAFAPVARTYLLLVTTVNAEEFTYILQVHPTLEDSMFRFLNIMT